MYQPKIQEDLTQRLYCLAKSWGVSMTALVNALLEKALDLVEEKPKPELSEGDQAGHRV